MLGRGLLLAGEGGARCGESVHIRVPSVVNWVRRYAPISFAKSFACTGEQAHFGLLQAHINICRKQVLR